MGLTVDDFELSESFPKPRGTVEANAPVLLLASTKWVEMFDFDGAGSQPRTIPLKLVLDQVIWIQNHCFYIP